jgi:hypothetical protein
MGLDMACTKISPQSKKFNRVLRFGHFPEQFAIADLLVLYREKSANPSLIKSFRPIFLTISAGKILTSYLANVAKKHPSKLEGGL